MGKRYWYKENISNAFIVKGAPVSFEQLEGNRGVLVLDTEKDAELIAALDEAATKGRGGIVRSNEKDYEIQKKSQPLTNRNASSRAENVIRVMPRDLSPSPIAKAADNGHANANAVGPDGLPMYDKAGLLLTGPTLDEWIEKGYAKDGYPPQGYAPRTIPRWQEAGLKSDPNKPSPIGIPQPDSIVNREATGEPAKPEVADPKQSGEPIAPTLKPATRRLGEEKEPRAKDAVPVAGTAPKPVVPKEPAKEPVKPA